MRNERIRNGWTTLSCDTKVVTTQLYAGRGVASSGV